MGKDGQGVSTGLRRGDVARMLGVHVSTVRRYEARGVLRPNGAKGEERVFDKAQVESLARVRRHEASSVATKDEGAADAAAIRMFRSGRRPEEVIISLEMPAARVSALFANWRRGFVLVTPQLKREMKERAESSEERSFASWEREMARAHAAGSGWTAPARGRSEGET